MRPDNSLDVEAGFTIDVVGPSPDKKAEFSAFMAESSSALGRTAWLLCGDVHQAEELTQIALTRTYLSWSRARENDPLAYARRVLTNLRIDNWRKHHREVLTSPESFPDSGHDPTDRLSDHDAICRALATLTIKQRRVVVLRHLEGLPEREVAAILGISVGTVKSTASRGLARLRQVLDPAGAAQAAPTQPERSLA